MNIYLCGSIHLVIHITVNIPKPNKMFLIYNFNWQREAFIWKKKKISTYILGNTIFWCLQWLNGQYSNSVPHNFLSYLIMQLFKAFLDHDNQISAYNFFCLSSFSSKCLFRKALSLVARHNADLQFTHTSCLFES